MSKKIDGMLFAAMLREGTLALRDRVDHINELNVFPVPDGDTGSNMFMTMQSAAAKLDKIEQLALGKVAETAAGAMLRGARGNSGVILSLLFRGIAKKLHNVEAADGRLLALALREGVDTAYKAVMRPAEGTILTVSRVCAQYALEQCQADNTLSVEDVLHALLERGQTALAETQQQNPTLAKAKVVDAGAAGFLEILSGMRDAFLEIPRAHVSPAPAPEADFTAIAADEITFTYCTEFIAQRQDKSHNISRLQKVLSEIGDSIVVVDDDQIIKVHVHTDQPHRALEEGLRFGALLTVKIENMRQQHTAKILNGTAPETEERTVANPEKKFGFVAVAAGQGIENVFYDLGVDHVVTGGQTMNPSTNDILIAADAVPAEIVYLLPNNKNIQMAAEQAIPLSTKTLIVIPTKNIPQGICAMLAFNADAEQGANTANMTQALANVHAAQVTNAARDSEFDGKKIKHGEFLGIYEGKLCANHKKINEVMKKLVREMLRQESTYITIIYGEGVEPALADKMQEYFLRENKELEINIIDGGQPVYQFIISVE